MNAAETPMSDAASAAAATDDGSVADLTRATPFRMLEVVRMHMHASTAPVAVARAPVRMSLASLLVAPTPAWLRRWLSEIAEYQVYIEENPERTMAISLGPSYADFVRACAASLDSGVHVPTYALMACLLFLMANQHLLVAALDAKDCHFVADMHTLYGTWLTGLDLNGALYTTLTPDRLADAHTVRWVLHHMDLYRRVYHRVPRASAA